MAAAIIGICHRCIYKVSFSDTASQTDIKTNAGQSVDVNRMSSLPLPGHIRPPTHQDTTMTPTTTPTIATSDSVTSSPSSPPMTAQAVQMPKLSWAKNSASSIQAQKSFTEIQAEEALKEKNSLKTA